MTDAAEENQALRAGPDRTKEQSGQPQDRQVGHTPDVVEAALADALTKAASAGQWIAVETLSRELQARREARAGVVVLDAARRRRGS